MSGPMPSDLRAAMRGVAATVAVVTAGGEDAPMGLTATSVTSVSLDPPSILVCVNRSSRMHRAIAEGGRFRVTFLRADQQEIAAAFGHSQGARFAVGEWDLGAPFGPRLGGAMAHMACELDHMIERGTHAVFFAAGGIAFHEGPLDVPSHGCVHLAAADAIAFFDALKPGNEVDVW